MDQFQFHLDHSENVLKSMYGELFATNMWENKIQYKIRSYRQKTTKMPINVVKLQKSLVEVTNLRVRAALCSGQRWSVHFRDVLHQR